MATITVNLRTPSYATLALAKAEIQTNPTFTGTPTTIYYSDNGSGPGPSQGQPGSGVYVFTDNTLQTAFNGQGNHWIFDGGNSSTHGNPYPYVLQIGNGSVSTINNGMDTFTCTDVGLTIPGGEDGELVAGTVNSGITITSYAPTNYTFGNSTYGAFIAIPAGYNNSGDSPINCVIQSVTVTTTTTLAPVPNYYEFKHIGGNVVQAYTEGATLLFPTFTLKGNNVPNGTTVGYTISQVFASGQNLSNSSAFDADDTSLSSLTGLITMQSNYIYPNRRSDS